MRTTKAREKKTQCRKHKHGQGTTKWNNRRGSAKARRMQRSRNYFFPYLSVFPFFPVTGGRLSIKKKVIMIDIIEIIPIELWKVLLINFQYHFVMYYKIKSLLMIYEKVIVFFPLAFNQIKIAGMFISKSENEHDLWLLMFSN